MADTLQESRVGYLRRITQIHVVIRLCCNTVLQATPTQEVRMELDDCVKSDMVSEDLQTAMVVVSECVDDRSLCDTQSSIVDEMSPLCYLYVAIKCSDDQTRNNVYALGDTGSEISIINCVVDIR